MMTMSINATTITPLAFFLHLLLLCQHLILAAEDPCSSNVHRTLDNLKRSPTFQPKSPRDLICDRSLTEGWYRFLMDGRTAEIPRTCAPINYCGTHAPIWLNAEDESLPPPGEERILVGCATWSYHGNEPDCCIYTTPIRTKNCGEFYVYYLLPAKGCSMAYCSQAVGDTPVFLGPPVIRPLQRSSGEVLLNCSFQVGPKGYGQKFRITWYKIAQPGAVHMSLRSVDETRATYDLLSRAGNIRMGDEVLCEVEAISVGHHGMNPSVTSAPFYAGVKIEPPSLVLVEGERHHVVTFTRTLPLVCPPHLPSSQCRFSIRLQTRNNMNEPSQSTDIALSTCEVDFTGQHCTDEHCGQVEVLVVATQDFVDDGNTTNVIETKLMSEGDVNWGGYDTLDIQVEVKDSPTSQCYSFSEPHYVTFDHKRFDNYGTGTFVLYKSTRRNFEVHSRIWQCSENSTHPMSCNCGFAAREGNDFVIISMCDQPYGKAMPTVSLKSLSGERIHARIHESRQGKVLTVVFNSGAFIRSHVETWGMSLTLQAPSSDYGHTRGLCGTFDGNSENDFHDKIGKTLRSPQEISLAGDFVENWRLPEGSSYFDREPETVSVKRPIHFCSCIAEESMASASFVDLDPMKFNLATNQIGYMCDPAFEDCSLTCDKFENVAYKPLLNYLDVTDEIVQNNNIPIGEILSRRSEPGFLSDQTPNSTDGEHEEDIFREKSMGKGIEWDVVQNYEPHKDEIEYDELASESNTENSLVEVKRKSRKYWKDTELNYPTPKGLTEEDVHYLCLNTLVNSSVGRVCSHMMNGNIMHALDVCVLDVTLMDDVNWASYSIPLLEDMCEESTIRKRMNWQKDQFGSWVMPKEIIDALNCPNSCSGNGVCLEFGCVCNPGFSSNDCSVLEEQPPTLLYAGVDSTCDEANGSCHIVEVTGEGFMRADSLKCLVNEAKYKDGAWTSFGDALESDAQYRAPNSIKCHIPRNLLGHHARNVMKALHLQIKVTNNGRSSSDYVILHVFNSQCVSCRGEGKNASFIHCVEKEGLCIINGKCYPPHFVNPDNSCEECLPHASRSHWSYSTSNKAPEFILPRQNLKVFNGQDVRYKFMAVDPEGVGVRFFLAEKVPDARLLSDGTLEWHASSNSLDSISYETFVVLAVDPCNKTAKFEVSIEVVPCECLNGGKCVTAADVPPMVGRFDCQCQEKFSGPKCEIQLSACSSSPCINGQCQDTESGYVCSCDVNFTGPSCETEINPCLSNPCFLGVQCSSSGDKYSCGACPPGMEGDGANCTDINDCTEQVCFTNVTCYDKKAPERGYMCGACPSPYSGNGITCTRVAVATEAAFCERATSCFPGVSCFATPEGGSACGPCPEGFSGNGMNCTPICHEECGNNRYCSAPDTCRCLSGYSGHKCQYALCQPPCLNGGICVRPGTCQCQATYTGRFCEMPRCMPGCQNRGRCLGFNRCSCPYGFVGRRCETPICRSFCKNRGSCVGFDRCTCPSGWRGATCEIPVCEPMCENGGRCVKPGVCMCPHGFFGSHCERSICIPPCRNGGHCMRFNTCSCPKGWTGYRCQTSICEPRCLNGGICWRPNKCSCPSGYRGRKCNKPICVDKCRNGGSCVKPNVCMCSPGYRGSSCEEPVCDQKCAGGSRCIRPNECQCRYGVRCDQGLTYKIGRRWHFTRNHVRHRNREKHVPLRRNGP